MYHKAPLIIIILILLLFMIYMDNCSRPPYAWRCGNKFFEIYPTRGLILPFSSSSTHLEVFHLQSWEAELSVIYAVHYPCHGSPYEPYLTN